MPLRRTKRTTRPPDHAGCAVHPTQAAVAECAKCGRGCCESCALQVRKQILCVDCAMTTAGVRAGVRRR